MIQSTTCLFVFLTHIWFYHAVTGGEIPPLDIHSLTYIYTAFSKPINLPGIHEFTAMGLLDGRMIDYYDSKVKKKIPKEPWMEERLDADYWEKGTQSRQSKEQWFKVNLGILRDRNGHSNDTDLHILQWRVGCMAERQSDHTLKFIKGKDEYSYDGDDYLSFDDSNKRWIAPVALALPTKRKWDLNKILNDYTQGYLERECVSWLSKFAGYGMAQLKKSKPPEVRVYGRKSKNPNNIMLHCMATGFYAKDVTLNITRNGDLLDEVLDKVQCTGVRPNGDNTFQIKKHVEILRSDTAKYSCEVIHPASKMQQVMDWESACGTPDNSGSNIGPVVAVVAVVAVVWSGVSVGIFFMKKKEVLCFSGKEKGPEPEEMKKLNGTNNETSNNDSGSAGKGSVEEVDETKKLTGTSNVEVYQKNQDSPTSSSADLGTANEEKKNTPTPSVSSGDSGEGKTSVSSGDSGVEKTEK